MDFFDDENDNGNVQAKWDCNQIRRKITEFLGTKEMTQKAFLEEIGHVSANSLGNFMRQKGKWDGTGNGTFWGATRFFLKREAAAAEARGAAKEALKALPPAERKRKAAEAREEKEAKKARRADILAKAAAVQLADDRVFDDCDDVRKALAEFFAEGSVPKSDFLNIVGARANQLSEFMRKKGETAGGGSVIYREGWRFLERLRVAEGRPKSQKRLRSEAAHPMGRELRDATNDLFVVPIGCWP